MTFIDKAKIVVKAARRNSMTANIWGHGSEVRVYLRRTNAAHTEAGYVRFFVTDDGKQFSKLVITASGTGSRTAEFEAEKVFDAYKQMKKEALASA